MMRVGLRHSYESNKLRNYFNHMQKTMKIEDLEKGPVRHQRLPESFVKRIRAFKEILAEVETVSLEETLDNFRRDQHPEREIVIWERIASTYQVFVAYNQTKELATKKEVLSVLLRLSTGVIDFSNLKFLSKELVQILAANYNGL